jgi:hypothetical protein
MNGWGCERGGVRDIRGHEFFGPFPMAEDQIDMRIKDLLKHLQAPDRERIPEWK